jgi:hypothetical protein
MPLHRSEKPDHGEADWSPSRIGDPRREQQNRENRLSL